MTQATPGRTERLRRFAPREWNLRVKLLVVLLVPGVLAVALGGLRIADQVGEAAELERVTQFVDVQRQVTDLLEALQIERFRATAYVAQSRSGDGAELRAATGEVDRRRAVALPAVSVLAADADGLVATQRGAEQALARLEDLRNLVLTSNAPAAVIISRYSDLVAQLVQLDDSLLRGINTTAVNGLASSLAGLAVARNEASLQLALITVATREREASTTLAGLAVSEGRLTTGLSDFRVALDAGQRVRYAGLVAGTANTDRGQLVQGLLAATGPLPTATANEAAAVYDVMIGELDAAEAGVRAELVTATAAGRSAAVRDSVVNAVLLVVALLIGSVIVGLIARALITSLRTLRSSALEVAEHRLPDAVARMRGGAVPDVDVEPVPVSTREEVGQVARAFDAVHVQAVRLAAEQATLQNSVNAMFVNLSRRSQSLVDRQLQLIEELESREQDSDQLSNLFRLDHLATRMRRNSENLLVLAGTDLAQGSSRPVPVVDVMQAAVSEVEQYERVSVDQALPVAVVGRAANDVQHLLAELLDNATTFSPPDSQVLMRSSRVANGPLVIEIIDRGVGMRPDELAAVNRRLGTPGDVSLDTARRMGLFVVARLAARHGIQVRLVAGSGLAPNPARHTSRSTDADDASGLTARVTIPGHLAFTAPQEPPPSRATGGRAAPTAFRALGSSAPPPSTDMWSSPPRPGGQRPEPRSAELWPVEPWSGERRTDERHWAEPRPATPPPPSLPRRDPGPQDTGRQPAMMPPPRAPEGAPAPPPAPIGSEPEVSSWFRSPHEMSATWQDTGPDQDLFTDAAQGRPSGGAGPPADDDVDENGLPRRRPGARLMRTGTDTAPAPPSRDPDAVRERLSGYLSGRSRWDADAGPAPAEDRA